MAFGKKKSEDAIRDIEKSSEEYYRLNTKAVDDLVNADESNSPEVTEEELRKYRGRKKISIPDWLKAVLIKFWFAGAVCFFIFWGLGNYITATLDMMLVFGMALGIITDLLTNNVLRFFAETHGANDRWMMFPKKKFSSFFLNIIYAFVLLALVQWIYNGINIVLNTSNGTVDTVYLGVEPLLFGLFYVVLDLVFITVKRTFISIVRDAKKSVRDR